MHWKPQHLVRWQLLQSKWRKGAWGPFSWLLGCGKQSWWPWACLMVVQPDSLGSKIWKPDSSSPYCKWNPKKRLKSKILLVINHVSTRLRATICYYREIPNAFWTKIIKKTIAGLRCSRPRRRALVLSRSRPGRRSSEMVAGLSSHVSEPSNNLITYRLRDISTINPTINLVTNQLS